MALIFDTGPLYTFLDRRDADHVPPRALIDESRESLVIPAPVIVEIDYLVRRRLGFGAILAFFDDVAAGAYTVKDLLPEDYRRVRYFCDRYADADIGFVDAAVLAVVERLNEPKLATFDHRHFGMLRPRHVDVLRLLPSRRPAPVPPVHAALDPHSEAYARRSSRNSDGVLPLVMSKWPRARVHAT